ncbi:YdeI/OmpD-associated family protein [Croceitalea dokdonensis]|nr:YdeI/OmpD-associated family protein [Croceitalea dokdonensis]
MATYKTNTLSFHGAIQKRKGGYVMMFGKRYQKELGISTNEVLQVQFFEDTSTYGVELPEEFEAVMFTDDVAHQIFESLTKGTQRGLIYTILRIKKSETRIEKTLLLCENLNRGIRESKQLFQR